MLTPAAKADGILPAMTTPTNAPLATNAAATAEMQRKVRLLRFIGYVPSHRFLGRRQPETDLARATPVATIPPRRVPNSRPRNCGTHSGIDPRPSWTAQPHERVPQFDTQ